MASRPYIRPVVQLLSTNGDGTGTTNMVGDYSTPDDFYIEDDGTDELYIQRIVVNLSDVGGVSGFEPDQFGALSTLSNGLSIQLKKSDNTVISNLTPDTIKSNGDWGKYAYDVQQITWGVIGTDAAHLLARWTFAKFTPDGLNLSGGNKLVCTQNDNLTGLITFTIAAEGYVRTATWPH